MYMHQHKKGITLVWQCHVITKNHKNGYHDSTVKDWYGPFHT